MSSTRKAVAEAAATSLWMACREMSPRCAAKTDRIRRANDPERRRRHRQVIPSHIFVNEVAWNAVARERDRDRACGGDVVHLDGVVGDLYLLEALDDGLSKIIIADTGHQRGCGAQGMRVVRKVGGRAAELRAGRQQIPEHLADADNSKAHI